MVNFKEARSNLDKFAGPLSGQRYFSRIRPRLPLLRVLLAPGGCIVPKKGIIEKKRNKTKLALVA